MSGILDCPVCGKCTVGDLGHKCNPRTLAKIENRMKRELQPAPPPSFDERLEIGFSMLELTEV